MRWIANAWLSASGRQRLVIGFALLLTVGAIGNAIGPSSPTTARAKASTPGTTEVAEVPGATASPTPEASLLTEAPSIAPTEVPAGTQAPAPTPRPTATPRTTATPKPRPTPTLRPTGVYGNPWGYDFSPGNLIYNPPGLFCDYFPCIASFWTTTNGYVVQCVDLTFSHSGGRTGVCSKHGGYYRTLYSH